MRKPYKMKTSTYDFPVELSPIVSQPFGVVIPNKLAVVRTDTKEPIGIVSNKYELLRHKDVVDGFRRALSLSEAPYEENIQITKNGARLFVIFKLSVVQMEVRKDDVVSLQFVVENSYDGESQLRIMLGAFRLLCLNGMVIGIGKGLSYSQRHIGSEGVAMDTKKLHDKIVVLTSQFKDTLPLLREMSRKEMPRDTGLLEELFNPKKPERVGGGRHKHIFPKYLVDAATDRYYAEGDKTVWGYYNAFTAAITHKLPKGNPQVALNYGKVAWDMAREALSN